MGIVVPFVPGSTSERINAERRVVLARRVLLALVAIGAAWWLITRRR